MSATLSPHLGPHLPGKLPQGLSRLFAVTVAVLLLLGLGTRVARAEPNPVDTAAHGLAVLGLGSSMDVTWPLARAVYALGALRPPVLDEAHARVLAGESAADSAPAELRDLSESRLAIHGDDAASRRLLASIAASLHVKGIVVVAPGATLATPPSARVFVSGGAGAFEAATYQCDPSAPVTWGTGAPVVTWKGAVQSLNRGFGDVPVSQSPAAVVPPQAPGLVNAGAIPSLAVVATPSGTAADKRPRVFYKSPWFWAALGAAALGATAVYFATRNDGSGNINLQVQVPK